MTRIALGLDRFVTQTDTTAYVMFRNLAFIDNSIFNKNCQRYTKLLTNFLLNSHFHYKECGYDSQCPEASPFCDVGENRCKGNKITTL